MTIALIAIAVAVIGAPLAAVVLVSFASLREESLHSVAGRAPGRLERSARRVLGFHADGRRKPISLAQYRSAQPAGRPVAAVKPIAPVR